MIPDVHSTNLLLRRMVEADFDRFCAIWDDPSVLRFTLKVPRGRDGHRVSFLRNAVSWAQRGFGQWAVCRADAPGRMIGQTGFFHATRGLGADFDAAPESGWVLGAEAQGQGVGTEAVVAAHRWFDAQPFGGRSHAIIDIGHRASERLAARMGYALVRTAEYGGAMIGIYARDATR